MLKRKEGPEDFHPLPKKITFVKQILFEDWLRILNYLDEETTIKLLSSCRTLHDLVYNDEFFHDKLTNWGYSFDGIKYLPEFDKVAKLNYQFYLILLKRKNRMSRMVHSIQKHFKQTYPPLPRSQIAKIQEERKSIGIIFPLDLILFLYTTGGFAEDIYGHNNLHVSFIAKEIETVQDDQTVYRMEFEEMVEAFEKFAEWHIPCISAKSNRFVSFGRQWELPESDDQFFVISDPDSKNFGNVAMFIYTYLGTIIKTKTVLELMEKLEFFLRMKPDREVFEFIETLPFLFSTTALVSSEF